jgi:hypothetical protein
VLVAVLILTAVPAAVFAAPPEEPPALYTPIVPPVLSPGPAGPPPPAPDLEQPLDPGRDGWGPYGEPSPPPGLYLGAEVGLVHPVVRNRITNDTPLQPSGDTLTLPSAKLPWTVSPDFELAYRLPRSLGYVSLNYRFVIATGNETDIFGDSLADLRSRLTEHIVNLDYGTGPLTFAAHWDFDWRVGARFANIYFDSTLQNSAFFQQASNNFRGVGPHARLDVNRHLLFAPGLALYGRVEGAVVIGRISQKFREQIGDVADHWEQNGIQTVPTLLVQGGLRWTPTAVPSMSWTLGYVYERWWYVGQLGTDSNAGAQSATRGETELDGIFLRGEIDF